MGQKINRQRLLGIALVLMGAAQAVWVNFDPIVRLSVFPKYTEVAFFVLFGAAFIWRSTRQRVPQ